MSNPSPRDRVRRMTGLSLMSAIVVVLTILCTFVRFGPFAITLALAPIIIGASVYGCSAGAILGAVLGVTTMITGVLGWDGGTVMLLLGLAPVACIVICIGKSTLAGLASGAVFKLIEKKNRYAAVIAAGIVCPLVNTGVFIIGMSLCYADTLRSWAGGGDMLTYLIFTLTGINFLVELGVNLVLSSGITTIIKYAKGRRR